MCDPSVSRVDWTASRTVKGRQTVTDSRETNSNRVKGDKQLQIDSGETKNDRLQGEKQ